MTKPSSFHQKPDALPKQGKKWDSDAGREKAVAGEGCQGWDTLSLPPLCWLPLSHSSPTLHKDIRIFSTSYS